MKSNRPVNLSMGQVLSVNMRSPVAIASILHRMSGIIIFLLIPLALWLLQGSLASAESFAHIKNDVLGNIAVKFLLWAFLSGLLYHFFVGVKHLLADLGVGEGLHSGRIASIIALVLSAVSIIAAFVWVMCS